MNFFIFRKIENGESTVGDILKKKREEKNLNIDKIAKELKINPKYLKALEKSEYYLLPGDIYAINFLKQYAHYLRINFPKIKKIYLREKKIYDTLQEENSKSKFKVPKSHFLLTYSFIKNFSLVIIVIICLGYLGVKLNNIIEPPELLIITPNKDFITKKNNIDIKGKTQPGVIIMINNEKVVSDKNNNFQKNIILKNGLNIIKIQAKKKYGREKIIIRRILKK